MKWFKWFRRKNKQEKLREAWNNWRDTYGSPALAKLLMNRHLEKIGLRRDDFGNDMDVIICLGAMSEGIDCGFYYTANQIAKGFAERQEKNTGILLNL